MQLLCISASNSRLVGENSTSTRVGYLVKKIVQKRQEDASVEVLPLSEYDIRACHICGNCRESGRCLNDGAFNLILKKIEEADGIFFIVPHYSPIPAKLIMIFEKVNEIMYAGWLNKPEYRSAWDGIPVAIIGHGGMTETPDNLRYYHDQMVATVAKTLRSFSFMTIGLDDEFPDGACFGLREEACLKKREGAVFPDIIQDWDRIERRIEPLIYKMLVQLSKKE